MRASNHARRAVPACTQPRAVQHGTKHAAPPPFPPCLSHRRALFSSPSSPLSPPSTTTASASLFASLHSGFHRPRHRSPSFSPSSSAFSSLFFVFAAIMTSPSSPPFPPLSSPAIHHRDPPPLHLPSLVLAAAAVHRHRLCSLLSVTTVYHKRHRAPLTFFSLHRRDPDAITLLSGSSTNRIPPTTFLLSPRTTPPPFASLHSVPHHRPPPPSSPNTASITHLLGVSLPLCSIFSVTEATLRRDLAL